MRKHTILILVVSIVASLVLEGVPSFLMVHGDHPPSPAPPFVYEVTTRGDFNSIGVLCCAAPDSYRIVSGGSLLSGDHIDSLNDYYNSGCGREVTVVVHGFLNDENGALEKFDRVRLSLTANNYGKPIIGYSWDSGSNIAQWYFANQVLY